MQPQDIDRAVFRKTGRPATFTAAADGDPVATYVIVMDHEVVEDYEVEVVEGAAVLTALRADIGRPVRGDQFVVDGTTWVVERPLASTDPSLIQIVCKEG